MVTNWAACISCEMMFVMYLTRDKTLPPVSSQNPMKIMLSFSC